MDMSETDTPLSHCRVVLVRPQFAANIGATARAMRNMGLTDLALVAPPADPSYPALNLAQAVAICLYEVRRAWLRRSGDRPLSLPNPPAPFADQERAFEDLRMALEEIHYLYGERGAALMHGLRHLLGRARPTTMEVRLLLGLARQIRWFVRHGGERTNDQ